MVDPDAKNSNRSGDALRGGSGGDLRAPGLPADRSESSSTSGAWPARPGDRRPARRHRQDRRQGNPLAPRDGCSARTQRSAPVAHGILNRPSRRPSGRNETQPLRSQEPEGLVQVLGDEPPPLARPARDLLLLHCTGYRSRALTSSAAASTSATTSRRNWLRSGEGVASGTGAAGS